MNMINILNKMVGPTATSLKAEVTVHMLSASASSLLRTIHQIPVPVGYLLLSVALKHVLSSQK